MICDLFSPRVRKLAPLGSEKADVAHVFWVVLEQPLLFIVDSRESSGVASIRASDLSLICAYVKLAFPDHIQRRIMHKRFRDKDVRERRSGLHAAVLEMKLLRRCLARDREAVAHEPARDGIVGWQVVGRGSNLEAQGEV